MLKQETKDLLIKVKRKILKNPEMFDMGSWFEVVDESLRNKLEDGRFADFDECLIRQNNNKCNVITCGTTGCIAGWALHCSKTVLPRKFDFSYTAFFSLGRKILKITEEQAAALFLESDWPDSFREKGFYGTVPDEDGLDRPAVREETNVQKAVRAAARIDYFIATEGR